jgi:hypothetical protein
VVWPTDESCFFSRQKEYIHMYCSASLNVPGPKSIVFNWCGGSFRAAGVVSSDYVLQPIGEVK